MGGLPIQAHNFSTSSVLCLQSSSGGWAPPQPPSRRASSQRRKCPAQPCATRLQGTLADCAARAPWSPWGCWGGSACSELPAGQAGPSDFLSCLAHSQPFLGAGSGLTTRAFRAALREQPYLQKQVGCPRPQLNLPQLKPWTAPSSAASPPPASSF